MSSFSKIRFPYATEVFNYSLQKASLSDQNHLIFQPFDAHLHQIQLTFTKNPIEFTPIEALKSCNILPVSKSTFIDKTEKAISLIHAKKFQKLVVSKTKLIPTPFNFKPIHFFNTLNEYYLNTCNSILFHNNSYWIGASPELFADISEQKITLMSLAGTVKENQEHLFSQKEREEQGYVTSYIQETLTPFCEPNSITVSVNKTLNAGPITHLLNEISGTLLPGYNRTQLLNALHPTPAVGGIPKESAVNYLMQQEPYRDLYTGYLGAVNPNSCRLYVNLRCMQVFKDYIVFYAGCGITADSNPEAEWEETEMKINTLLKLVEKAL